MIPSSDIQNILGGRNAGVDAQTAHFDMLESDFTLLSPRVRRAYHEEVIKGPFSKQLGSFTTIMMDEINSSLQQVLGKDQEGDVEIKVFDTMAKVIACTANQVLVGKEVGMW
jgi:orotate phosphoribosyltransferase-like protein